MFQQHKSIQLVIENRKKAFLMNKIDNFISQTDLNNIVTYISDSRFNWEHFSDVVGWDKSLVTNSEEFVLSDVGYRHCFVREGKPTDTFVVSVPVFDAVFSLMPRSRIWQCHANVIYPDETKVGKTLLPHVDLVWSDEDKKRSKFYTGLLYLNNSGGDTVLYNERFSPNPVYVSEYTRITPEANRFIYWESDVYHAAPASGNTTRYVINVNWFCPIS